MTEEERELLKVVTQAVVLLIGEEARIPDKTSGVWTPLPMDTWNKLGVALTDAVEDAGVAL